MGQHGAPLIRDVENIPVAFLALLIFKRGIGGLARLVMVIFIHGEMDDDVFDAMGRFCIEEIEGVMGGREMAVHAISHKPLGIVYMGRGLPGIVGKLYFMAGGAELRRGCPHHGVVGNTEYGEGNEKPQGKEERRFPAFSKDSEPQGTFTRSARVGVIHILPRKKVRVRLNGLSLE